MPAINQRIPNFLGGVSQQPDTIKFPGQVRVMDNIVPDVTFGAMKRPPGEFVKSLSNANSTGYWYEILRDSSGKYLVQITPGNTGSQPIRVWDLADGTEKSLTNSAGDAIYAYLSGATSPYTMQSIQDYTLIGNPNKTVYTKDVITNSFMTSYPNGYSFARLDTVAYNTEYVLYSGTAPSPNTYYRVTALTVKEQGLGINAITLVNPGSGYGSAPTVTILGDNNNTSAQATCTTDGHGKIKTVTVTHRGSGFTTAPTITFVNTNGTANASASATCTVNDGETWTDANKEALYAGQTQFSFSSTDPDDSTGSQAVIPERTTGGTYSQSGTTITISKTSHGFSVGSVVDLDFLTTNGTMPADGEFVISTTATNSFTVKSNTSLSASGNVTIKIGVSDVEGHVLVNANAYVHDNVPNYDGSEENQLAAENFQGYTQTYYTRYTATVVLKSGGVIKTTNRSEAENLTIEVRVKGIKYQVDVQSVEPVETYEGINGIAYYKTPVNPDKGRASIVGILKSIESNINGTSEPTIANLSAEVIGNGLFLYNHDQGSAATDISFLGGTVNESMAVIGNTAQNVAKLPSQCKDGYIVQVANTEETETDDYYLKFVADNGSKGPGKWEEVAKPHQFTTPGKSATYTRSGTTITITLSSHGFSVDNLVHIDFTGTKADEDDEFTIKTVPNANAFTVTDNRSSGTVSSTSCTVSSDYMIKGLDPASMPHALVNNLDGTFTFKKLDETTANTAGNDNYWKYRDVGDDTSNPFPTFEGLEIQKIFFYRNRLGMIANEQIVMSRPGDFFNFFIVSALTTSDDNPIDITVSDVKPAFINHVLPINKGVMMFSDNGQFLLFTESDIFSPKTARLKKISSYECDSAIQPLDLGTSVMFTSSVAAYTRAYESTLVDDDIPPKILEQTRVVPEYIPKDITSSTNSAALGIVTFSKKGESTLYHFKYFDSGEKRDQSAWYSWTIEGSIQHSIYTGGVFYTVSLQGSDYILNKHEYLTDATSARTYTLGGGTVGSPLSTSRWFEACLDNMTFPTAISYTAQGPTVTGPPWTDLTIPYTPTTATDFYAVALDGTDTSGNKVAGTVIKADSVSTNKATFLNVDMTGWTVAVGYRYTSILELPNYYSTMGQNQNDINADLRISGFNFEMGVSGPMEFHLSSIYADMADYIHYETGMKLDDSDFGKPPSKLMKSVRVPIYKKNDKYNLTIKIPDPFSTALISGSWDGIYNQRRHARK